jgi:hypothetical protein
LTVVYSDSDDGVHEKSRIATSELQDGEWVLLGAPYRPTPEAELATADTACDIEAGTLRRASYYSATGVRDAEDSRDRDRIFPKHPRIESVERA